MGHIPIGVAVFFPVNFQDTLYNVVMLVLNISNTIAYSIIYMFLFFMSLVA